MKLFRVVPIFLLFALLTVNIYAQDDEEAEEPVTVDDDGEADLPEEEVEELTPEEQIRRENQAREEATGILDPGAHPGRIVFRKKLETKQPAVGQPMEVEYTMWNVGDSEVFDIELVDESWSADEFNDATRISITHASLAAGKSYSEKFTLTPSTAGKLKLIPAKITYKSKIPDEEEAVVFTGEGATEGLVEIATAQYYARNVASHWFDWILFAVISAPSTLFPYLAGESTLKKYGKAKTA